MAGAYCPYVTIQQWGMCGDRNHRSFLSLHASFFFAKICPAIPGGIARVHASFGIPNALAIIGGDGSPSRPLIPSDSASKWYNPFFGGTPKTAPGTGALPGMIAWRGFCGFDIRLDTLSGDFRPFGPGLRKMRLPASSWPGGFRGKETGWPTPSVPPCLPPKFCQVYVLRFKPDPAMFSG